VYKLLFFNQNDLKIDERLNELECKFEQEISMLKFQNEDQNEEIQILKTARKNQNKRLKDVENELSELKSKNDEKTIKIDQLEKMIEDQNKLVSKSLAGNQPRTVISAESEQSGNGETSSLSTMLPSSCNDLSSNGHRLNGIYPMFDLSSHFPLVLKI